MYNEKIEQLIKAALADGVLTEKEKQVLFKRAQEHGIDLDEFEMVLDARLVELQKAEQEKREKSAPKSDKYGDVRKCPACGAIVGAFKGSCPECGYEFSNVDANLSSKKLYDALAKETSLQKKKEIIETFPLPNTKADLLEFLTALKPRIFDQSSEFAAAYYKKYAECIEKAKVSFFDDKQLQPFIDNFEIFEKELKRKKVVALLKKHWILLAVITVALVVTIALCVSYFKASKLETEYKTYIENNDVENAKTVLKKIGINEYDKALELIELYITNGDVDNAIYVYEKMTPDHCSTYHMQYHYSYGSGRDGRYEETATNLIYYALINSERMDDALKYHSMHSSSGFTAEDYYDHMSEVVNYYCQKNNKAAARKYVKEHLIWFKEGANQWNNRLIQQINNY